MNREELDSIYLELQKFLCDCGTIGKYHELLDELYLTAKAKITTSNSKYMSPSAQLLVKCDYAKNGKCSYDNENCMQCDQ